MRLPKTISPKYRGPFAIYVAGLQTLAWLADPRSGLLSSSLLPEGGAIILIASTYVLMYVLCTHRGEILGWRWLRALPLCAAVFAFLVPPTHPAASAAVMFLALVIGLAPREPERQMLLIKRQAKRLARQLLAEPKLNEPSAEALEFAVAEHAQHPNTTDQPTQTSITTGQRMRDVWDVTATAIYLRAKADQQLLLLDRCIVSTNKALALHKAHPELVIQDLISHYRNALKLSPKAGLSDLRQALIDRSNSWRELLYQVHRIKTRVFAIQSLYRLALRSRIEMASLVIGFLMAAGALQVAFMHQAAAGTNVATYWTLDDFFVQAIAIALPVALVLLLIEGLFRFLRISVEKGKPLIGIPPWVFLKPNLLAVCILFGVLWSSTMWGYRGGTSAFTAFAQLTNSTAESATVTDGTTLRHVHLVATTSRTAIFLQKKENLTWNELRISELQPHSYSDVLSCTFAAFFPGLRDTSCSPTETEPYRVIVMDRAHVVCHATGDTCETLPRRPPFAPLPLPNNANP